jgi:hypothetical protein
VGEGLKNQWNPDDVGFAAAVEFGKKIAKA